MPKPYNKNITTAIFLSRREKEVLELLSAGHSSLEIASTLLLSYHTLNDYRKSLKTKLGAKNVAQMIRKGFELQLLNPITVNYPTHTP